MADWPESDDESYVAEKGNTYPIHKSNVSDALSMRGFHNGGCLFILIAGILALLWVHPFIRTSLTAHIGIRIVYPVTTFVKRPNFSNLGGYNIGGINASGQVPTLTGNWGLIDAETPKSAYTRTSWADGKTQLRLVFSDEFNLDGRTFYPGDDPYWEAENFHYWVRTLVHYLIPFILKIMGLPQLGYRKLGMVWPRGNNYRRRLPRDYIVKENYSWSGLPRRFVFSSFSENAKWHQVKAFLRHGRSLQCKSKCCFDLILGTNFVSQADTLKLPSNCLVLIMCMVFGLLFGRWEIWDVRVMVLLSKEWYVQRNIKLPHLLRFGSVALFVWCLWYRHSP